MTAVIMRLGDTTVAALRRALGPEFFNANAAGLERATALATPVAALVGLMLGVIGAIKTDSLTVVLLGMIWVVVVALGYYAGAKMLPTCAVAVQNSRTAISSRAVLDVLGLLLGLLAVGALAFGIYTAVKLSSIDPLLTGIGGAITLAYFTSMMLNPELVTTDIVPQSTAGSDAIAVSLLLTKALVRLSPIAMGSAVIIGTLNGLMTIVNVFKGDIYLVSAAFSGGGFAGGVMVGLLYPVIAYVAFIFLYLLNDIALAILKLHRTPSP